MPQTQIIGGGIRDVGTALSIDSSFAAAHIALKPLEYSYLGQVLGHYSCAQVSGTTMGIAALGNIGSIRWIDTTRFLVLMGIRVGWSIVTAVTAATVMDMQAIICRGFTVDFTSNTTAANLAAGMNTNKMRYNMGASLLGTVGPRITTTAVMGGQTSIYDAFPFAMTVWPNQPSGNTTVSQAVGTAVNMQDLYNWNKVGQHPIVLSANEGILIQSITAEPTTGGVKYYIEWSWAEVAVF